MSYRNDKRWAAVWLLEQLMQPPKMETKGIDNPTQPHIEIDTKNYTTLKLLDLEKKGKYNKELLNSAVELLFKNEHVVYRDQNAKNRFDYAIKANEAGEEALKEEFYQLDVYNYKNDKYFSYSRWVIPVGALAISLLSLCVSTCNSCNSGNSSSKECKNPSTQAPQSQRIDTNSKNSLENTSYRRDSIVKAKFDTLTSIKRRSGQRKGDTTKKN